MRSGRLLGLVAQNLRRSRREFVLSSFGIAMGIASLGFFTALALGVRSLVLDRVFHIDRIEVEPARSDLEIPLLGGLGGSRPITDETVAKLRALPGVRAAAPRMRLAFPAKAWGGVELLGQNRYAEIIGDGVDPAAVAGESFSPQPFADLSPPAGAPGDACNSDGDCKKPGEYCAWDVHECQRPVPMIISKVLLELYNSGFARSHNLPRVSSFLASRFRGFTITIELGQSFMGARAARGVPRQRRAMLVGVSDRAIPIGVSFPLAYVRRWNAEYAGEAAARGYSSVVVEVKDQRAVTEVAAAARGLGLSVIDSGAEQAGLAITLIGLLFVIVSLAILAVATINIAHTFFRAVAERRREIGVLRAVGASGSDIRQILLGEAAAIGLCGGGVGLAAARVAALLCDLAARSHVPELFRPESFFRFPPLLVAGVLAFALLTCLAGALLPALAAARMEPAEALAAR
ncbi:MAG: FtsX-like permease family protein [Myxococcales bacterium]|nr:FtsX-like permease family protein [Myxococcales bacterium]